MSIRPGLVRCLGREQVDPGNEVRTTGSKPENRKSGNDAIHGDRQGQRGLRGGRPSGGENAGGEGESQGKADESGKHALGWGGRGGIERPPGPLRGGGGGRGR